MPDTRRLDVIKKIQTKLKEIKAPDYPCDLADNVFIGRLVTGEETDLPFITLWEPFSEDGPDVASKVEHRSARAGRDAVNASHTVKIRYYLQGFVSSPSVKSDIPTEQAYMLLGCIDQCLGPELEKPKAFGANSIEMGAGLVRPANTMDAKNPYCLVTLDITLTEERGKPYV